jgi:hypothetical protein
VNSKIKIYLFVFRLIVSTQQVFVNPFKSNIMKRLFLGIIMALIFIDANSQAVDSPLTIQKKKVYQNGNKLKPAEFKAILENNTSSVAEYKLFNKNRTASAVFMCVGLATVAAGTAVMLSSTMKQANDLDNGEYNEYSSGLGLIGMGLLIEIAGIPFSISANKHLKKSVDMYNSSINVTGSNQIEFKLIVYSNGLGVRMRF